MPRARSQRASQNPSRPASYATAMRVIVRPFSVASARQRINKRSNSTSLGSSFFSGWRSIPGTMPATSQLAWLISMTAMIVLSWSKGVRDRLKSSSCCAMGRSIALLPATMVTSRHHLLHSISGATHGHGGTGSEEGVRDLQDALKILGHDPGPIDGAFGAKTESAVKAFQQVRGITVDGIVGRVTWINIDEADQSEPVLRLGSTGLPVRRLQSRMSAVGFDTGGVDGRFSPKTEAALRQLQQRFGLAVDGVDGPKTWAVVDALEKALTQHSCHQPPLRIR